MGCELSGHHSHNSNQLSPPRRPSSSSNSDSSTTRGLSQFSQSSFDNHTSFYSHARRSLTRQRTTEQIVYDAVVKRLPLNEYFSEFEKDVLLSTWEALHCHSDDLGSCVLLLALQMCPALNDVFDVQLNEENQIVLGPAAHKHSKLYMNLINNAVWSLEDPKEGVYDSILIAGARNASMPDKKRGYLKVLKKATLTTWESLLGEEFTEDVKRAWQTLLEYVEAVMSEGSRLFIEETSRMTAAPSQRPILHTQAKTAATSAD